MVDNDKANKSISDTDNKAEGLGKRLLNGVATAAKWGAAIGAGALVAGGAMVAFATKAGAAADRLLDLSDITGMSTDEIQRWERVTKVAGVSTDAITNASQKLTKSMDSLSSGTGKGSEALKKLGLSYDELSKMNADERMNAVTKALSEVEDKTERAKIGTDLLGGSWKDIAPIVGMGAEAMEAAKASANIISEEDLARANDFRIKMDLMADRVQHFGLMLGVAALPVLEKVFGFIEQAMPHVQTAFEVGFKAISVVVEMVANIIEAVLMPIFIFVFDWVKANLPQIEKTFKDIFKSIADIIKVFVDLALKFWNTFGSDIIKIATTTFNTIWQVVQSVLTIIQGIINVFIGLITGDWQRLSQGLTQIWQGLWNGIRAIVSGAWSNLSTAFSSLGSSISSWFSGLASDARAWGRNMIQGFIDGIKGMISKVSSAAKEVVKAASDYLKFWSPAKKGEGRFIVQWGENMIGGFLDGVSNAIPDIEKVLNKAIPNMSMSNILVPSVAGANTTSYSSGDIIIQNMNVRNDQDIRLIAQELFYLQQGQARGLGIR